MWKIQIPKTESKVEEVTLFKWHKKEGDRVIKGELIAEIETFKAAVEINSPETGIIYKIFVKEEETVPVNTVIAILIEEGEEISPEEIKPFLRNQKEEGVSLKEEKISFPKKDLTHSSDIKNEKIKIAPIARKLALAKGVDLSLINGSGPGGVITKKDIEGYLFKTREKTNFTIKEVYKLTGLQKISAERLTYSYKNIPQFTLCRKIDIASLLNIRKEVSARLNQHLSLVDFIIKALVLTFKKFPEFNAIFEEENYKFIKEININLAVATDRGLMVPVLKNLEGKDIFEISQLRREITDKALKGKLQPEDFEKGTFTITNLGLQGIEYFNPIINPPQVAILGIGKSEKMSLPLSLSMDHRIIDGAKGADFLQLLSKKLASYQNGGD
ncbi:2-oxo acid dehydrogenase subunit E2 [bacterium]|nr:2-oxo acid dehydrogenase subunit E2 [bacterium]MBU4601999.1 2-oxo acid dehydrogenase subunit E2 [bacterium]